jgi:hypothetical protein
MNPVSVDNTPPWIAATHLSWPEKLKLWRKQYGVPERPEEDWHREDGRRRRNERYCRAYRPTDPADQARRVAKGELRHGLVPMAKMREAGKKDTPTKATSGERTSSTLREGGLQRAERRGEADGR